MSEIKPQSLDQGEVDLLEVTSILDEATIDNWVCHGTLLGLIRDKKLIPWDDDIDIAVWGHQTTKKEIIELLRSHGYEHVPVACQPYCLHFKGREKFIDISFYIIDKSSWSISWLNPPNSFLNKFLLLMMAAMLHIQSDDYLNSKAQSTKLRWITSLGYISFWSVGALIPEALLLKMESQIAGMIGFIGYSYDIKLMKFKRIKFHDRTINIPAMEIEVLKATYGDSWGVPNAKFLWYSDASNLSRA